MKALHVSVMTPEQLEALGTLPCPVDRIYAEAWTLLGEDGSLTERKKLRAQEDVPVYLALPRITRQEQDSPDMADLRLVASQAAEKGYSGLLARNLEQLGYLALTDFPLPVVADYGIYIWNPEAWRALCGQDSAGSCLREYSLPFELSLAEQKKTADGIGQEIPCGVCIYGRIPMMVSAECVKMNTDTCTKRRGRYTSSVCALTDRTNRTLPVTCVCRYCYNMIWNAYPVSLHKALGKIRRMLPQAAMRVDLTTETKEEAALTVSYLADCLATDTTDRMPPYHDYTTGRSGKGVD